MKTFEALIELLFSAIKIILFLLSLYVVAKYPQAVIYVLEGFFSVLLDFIGQGLNSLLQGLNPF